MDTFILFMDIIGTIAFAISGAMEGVKKNMDLFGVCVLGMVTATGGGMIRDIVLGITPPGLFVKSTDVIIAVIVSAITFLSVYIVKKINKNIFTFFNIYNLILFTMDTLGLGIFTVMGMRVALNTIPDASSFLLIFVGVITGVGGGLLRDMMSCSIPYIFRKHIYATASLAGAAAAIFSFRVLSVDQSISMLIGAGCVIVIRYLAAGLRWNLPKIDI